MTTRPIPGFRAIVSIALLVFAVACTKPPNDTRITSNIQARLAADSGLQAKQLTVQSQSGTVTLAGSVDNDAQRDAATKYASSEPGVKTVINNLVVAPAEAAAQPAPAGAEPAPAPPPPAPAESKPSASHRKSHRAEARDDAAQADAAVNPPQEPPASSTEPAAAPPPETQAAAPPPPPAPVPVTVPSGVVLSVRLMATIDSGTAQTGDTFHATLDAPLTVDGTVVVPAHYEVAGHVVNAQASGKFQGRALLVLQLDRIKVGNKSYSIQTDQFSQQTGSRGKNTAEKVGGGAVVGAILGGIFGGGKGAAVGSAAGAGAGGGVQAASKRPDIKLSSEKVLTFTLQAPVSVIPTTKPAREGQKLATPDAQ